MRTFVKRNPATLEAAGLRWLAAAGARVPEVVSATATELVLEPAMCSPTAPVARG